MTSWPSHQHRRAAARGLEAGQLQQPGAELRGDHAQRVAGVELQRGDQRQRQHHQAGERQRAAAPPAGTRAARTPAPARRAASRQRRHASAPARRWPRRPAPARPRASRGAASRAGACAVPHQPGGQRASASRPSGSSEPSATARCTKTGRAATAPAPAARASRAAPQAATRAARATVCAQRHGIAAFSAAPRRAALRATARRRAAPAPQQREHQPPAPACSAPPRVGAPSPTASLLTPSRQRRRLVRRRHRAALRVAHDLVDRDEAGVVRQQAVAQAERGDRLASARWPPSSASSSPSAAMRWRAHRWRSATASGVAAPARRARRGSGRSALWPSMIELGAVAARRATCRTPPPGGRPARRAAAPARRRTPPGLRSAPSRCVSTGDSIMRRRRSACVGGLLRLGDDEGLALAGARHAFDQVAVDRRADAEREHVGLRRGCWRTSSNTSRSTVT